MYQHRYKRISRLSIVFVMLLLMLLAGCAITPTSAKTASPSQGNTTTNSWSVSPDSTGTILQIGYGSGTNFPQYAALYLNTGYFRMIYSTTAGWGTSIVLLPALWSKASCPTDYCQGATITASWQSVGSNLVFSINGTIATLQVSSTVTLTPPANNHFVAQVSTSVVGSVVLDNRPGEAFKPVMLSSMHISPTQWDTQAAFIGTQTYALPSSGWIIQPPIIASNFGLQGGTSSFKTNAPTVEITLNKARQVTGWVTPSSQTSDDNVAFWCATSKVLPSWSFSITAEAGQNL